MERTNPKRASSPPRQNRLAAVLSLLALVAGICGCAGTRPHPVTIGTDRAAEAALRADLRQQMSLGEPTVDIVFALATSYSRSGEADSSVAALEQAMGIDPEHLPSLALLSRLYYERGDIDRGVALLEPLAASRIDHGPEILTNLALLKLAWGDVVAAESLLIRAATEHPDFAPAHGNLAFLHLEMDNPSAAEAELERAVALDDRVPEFHNNLGIIHRRQLRFDDSARAFERAIALAPDFREAHHNLALLTKLYLFDEERSRRHFDRFLALGGEANEAVTALFGEEKTD
jgi:tetratricopeptide (TPR) repeat protein